MRGVQLQLLTARLDVTPRKGEMVCKGLPVLMEPVTNVLNTSPLDWVPDVNTIKADTLGALLICTEWRISQAVVIDQGLLAHRCSSQLLKSSKATASTVLACAVCGVVSACQPL